MMFHLSPLTAKRFRAFRRIRRAWYSLVALGAIFVFCMLADVVCPVKPGAVADPEALKGSVSPVEKVAYDVRTARYSRLPDGTIVTGKNSPLLHAASSCVLNAVKVLAGLPDDLPLISPDVINSVGLLKKNILKIKRVSLALDETLIALSVSMANNPTAKLAVNQLSKLGGCEMHCSHLPTPGDEAGLRKLGINLTCDPVFASRDLFVD